jgi:hypothetical protein
MHGRRMLVWDHYCWDGRVINIPIPLLFIERERERERPIHDSIRELVTWECKEHGVKS